MKGARQGLRRAAAMMLAVLAAAGCGRGGDHERGGASVAGGIAVTTIRVSASGQAGAVVLPGRVKAREEVTVAARIQGRLTAIPVREGGAFRYGQALVVFDAPEARAALESARAALRAAESRRDLAVLQQARMESLFAARVAARHELELVQAERDAAEASWSGARAAVEQWQESTSIPAPFDGVVSRRYIDPGQTVTPGQAILDIRSDQVSTLEVAVPESELGRLPGALVAFQVQDGAWHPARVVRVDGATDVATRTRLATLRPAEGHLGLEAGAYARVRIEHALPAGAGAARPDSLAGRGPMSLPATSLVRRGSLTGVYVVREGRAWLRWLRAGRERDGSVEVLAGLSPGDEVVVSPAGLVDGCRVKVAR